MGFRKIKGTKKSYAQKIVSQHKKRITNISNVKVAKVKKS